MDEICYEMKKVVMNLNLNAFMSALQEVIVII